MRTANYAITVILLSMPLMAASAAVETDPSPDASFASTDGFALSPTLHPNLLRPAAFRFEIEALAHDNEQNLLQLDIGLLADHVDPDYHPVPTNPFDIAVVNAQTEYLDSAVTLPTTLKSLRTSQARFDIARQTDPSDPGLTPLSSGTSIWNLPLGDGFSLDGRGWRREIDEDQRIFVVGAEAKVDLTHFLDLRMGYEVLRTQAGSVGLDGAGENDGMYAQFRFRF